MQTTTRAPEGPAPPKPIPPAPTVELPESARYRLKNRLLGPPLHTDQLIHERLGKPTALAVFASDNLSSVAYGTEEILTHLSLYCGFPRAVEAMRTARAAFAKLRRGRHGRRCRSHRAICLG